MAKIARDQQRRCMWIDETQDPSLYGGYVPSLVTENEPGHQPMTGATGTERPWVWGGTLAEAKAACLHYNLTTFGLTERDCWLIVASSIGAQIDNEQKRQGVARG